MNPRLIAAAGTLILSTLASSSAWALKVSSTSVGKRVIEIRSLEETRIQLPNETFYEFGKDFYARLVTTLTQSGKFIVVDPKAREESAIRAESSNSVTWDGDYAWTGSQTPAVRLKIDAKALSFVTGSRGTRYFYGFEPGQEPLYENEFPIQLNGRESIWFSNTFDPRGKTPFDSRSGLDLGEGFSLDVIFAFLKIKYAGYRSHILLNLSAETPYYSAPETLPVDVTGHGYYYDLAGMFAGYSLGVVLARTDALLKAFNRAIEQTTLKMVDEFQGALLTAQVDGVVHDGDASYVLMGTGPFSGIAAGTRYHAVERPNVVIEVLRSVASGSIGRVVRGNESELKPGMLLKEYLGDEIASEASGSTAEDGVGEGGEDGDPATVSGSAAGGGLTVDAGTANFDKIDFAKLGIKDLSWLQRIWAKIKGLIFIPYRIMRYFSYDQRYKGDTSAVYEGRDPLVAVIDSGFDYNSKGTRGKIWVNPDRGARDSVGWDFISGDARPYDDHGHGTRVTSALLKVNPEIKILPVKAFDPWGHTSSDSLFASFKYAVERKPDAILVAWNTFRTSKAIEDGVKLAQAAGIPVVVSAGNEGEDLERSPYYPAVLSRKYENILTVAAVDEKRALPLERGKGSNYGASFVGIAARGTGIETLNPRGQRSVESGADIAAARVAAVVAQEHHAAPSEGAARAIQRVQARAKQYGNLMEAVRDGLVLE